MRTVGSRKPRAAVVGAGLAGLTAAWRLQQAGFSVQVFERETRVGGRTRSILLDSCTVDTGATVFLSSYVESLALLEDMGLTGELEPVHGEAVIPREGRLHNLSLDAPLKAMFTGVVGWGSKLALLKLAMRFMKLHGSLNFESLGAARGEDGETLAQYCRRSFPPEVYDYLLNPALKFLYLHDGDSGSLIELLWWMAAAGVEPPRSLRRGTSSLCDALASQLTVQTGVEVSAVRRHGESVEVVVGEQVQTFDACVMAVPASVAADLCAEVLDPSQRRFLRERRYDRTMTVSLCTRERPPGSTLMVMMPDGASRALATVIHGHTIGKARVPPDRGIINAYFMKEWSERHWDLDDDAVVRAAQEEVARFAPQVRELRASNVQRWEYSAAISEPGDCALIAQFEQGLDERSPIRFIGDYRVQASMNVAVVGGNRAAAGLARLFGLAAS